MPSPERRSEPRGPSTNVEFGVRSHLRPPRCSARPPQPAELAAVTTPTSRSMPTLARQIAESVAAPAALAPYLGELFRGMPALGSFPGRVVRLLRDAGVSAEHRVLDLACGPGANAIALAKRLGCSVHGVDACPAFLEAAEAAAQRAGLSRCTFARGDVRRFRPARRFDVALMIGLDGYEAASRRLRSLVKPGGLYVFDDVIRSRDDGPNWTHVPTRAAIETAMRNLGDRVVAIDLPTPAAVHAKNRSLGRRLLANTQALREARPSLRGPLQRLLDNHRFAHRYLGSQLRPLILLAQRSC